MKAITQFAKIVSTSGLSSDFFTPFDATKCIEDSSQGPASIEFAKYFSQRCYFRGSWGKAILYAVRMTYLYVLSINGRSTFFSSNEQLYVKLVSRNIVKDSDALRHEFSDYHRLDWQRISELTGCTVSTIPLYAYIADCTDIYFRQLRKECVYQFSAIPCLHEDKVVLEFFIQTTNLTPKIRDQLKKKKYKEFEWAFFPPDNAMQEWAQSVEKYF